LTSRATGFPAFPMMISSPLRTLSIRADSCALASEIFVIGMIAS
jgi:hypothetical protein